jgi:hypothetical protein
MNRPLGFVVPVALLLVVSSHAFVLADDLLLGSGSSGGNHLLGNDALLSGGDDLPGGDDLLSGGNDLLLGGGSADASLDDLLTVDTPDSTQTPDDRAVAAAHADLFLEDKYPSASTCATCHPRHFREWSVSPHAYSQISPVSAAMSATVNILTGGTSGDFCFRCHSPVGANLGEPVVLSNMDRHPASREGITCVACHRVDAAYGRINGRLAMQEGGITSPIFGPTGNDELARVLDSDEYRVTADPEARGRKIHGEVKKLEALSESSFCAVCHDVTLVNGFRAEETFSEYKNSPAAKRGESCQDCHMGKEHGIAAGYDEGPAAIVGGVPTESRKLTNHMFAGPDYSVVHPGFFPHNVEAQRMASIREWLEFDHEAGWGTDAFEDHVADDYVFPKRWISLDDRYDARAILNGQFELLAEAEEARRALLSRAYLLGDIVTERADDSGLRFKVQVKNGTDGHNAPTGFERVVFLRVTVTDAAGAVIYRSGDLDPNGDLRDGHSVFVSNGEVPLDKDLFNMQFKFITRLLRGGEREQTLPANYSIDVLPFVRPETSPTVLMNHPLGVRGHKKGIEANGERWPVYTVPAEQLTGQGPYSANVQLIAGMIPVNLLMASTLGGLDYGMSPRQIADRIVAGHQVLWEKEALLQVPGQSR